jgi:hypothetical protein
MAAVVGSTLAPGTRCFLERERALENGRVITTTSAGVSRG